MAGVVLIGGSAVLLAGLIASASVGAADIAPDTVWNAVFRYDPESMQHQIIRQLRLPRAVIGALVGVCFAVAGAIMQGMTRNPLASPSIMGVNAGSAFLLVLAFAFFPDVPYSYLMVASFIGATTGAALVYGVGSLAPGGLTPVRLALAGAAVSALLGSLASGIVIYYQIAQDLLFWYAGGVAGTTWFHVQTLLPWAAIGLIVALVLARSITVLSLGEEIATGLGQRTVWVKAAGSVAVVLLVGAAISTAGPIGFVGLVIPHITRFLVGVDYRWVIPCSAVLGGLLLVVADIGARMLNPPFETPVGLITALIGVPFFLYLARRDPRGV